MRNEALSQFARGYEVSARSALMMVSKHGYAGAADITSGEMRALKAQTDIESWK